jgi:hypothetical protein
MTDCELSHIPKRLHTEDKPIISIFVDGEFLYRRCNLSESENPYLKISLAELSHNRSGHLDNIISNRKDVLFNISLSEKYSEEIFTHGSDGLPIDICTLKVENPKNVFYQKIIGEFSIDLIHNPECCMYPHCVIRISKGDEVLKKFEDFKNTLGTNKYKKERQQIRHEIAGMICSKKIIFPEIPN